MLKPLRRLISFLDDYMVHFLEMTLFSGPHKNYCIFAVFLNTNRTICVVYSIALLLLTLTSLSNCQQCKLFSLKLSVFYRAMLCIRGTSHGPVSVSVSVCLSVTSRCSSKTAKRRITKTTPHDSPGTIISCLILIQTGFTFQVPAYPDCPGKEAIKQVCVLITIKTFLMHGTTVLQCVIWWQFRFTD